MIHLCLDTQVLIWGIKKEASENRRHMLERAAEYFAWLEKENTRIFIPSIVVAEFLINVHPDRHDEVARPLFEKYRILPFDGLAALHCARIWQRRRGDGIWDQLVNSGEATRRQLHADCKIVATALAHGIINICSEDNSSLAKIGRGFISVVPMAVPPEPEPPEVDRMQLPETTPIPTLFDGYDDYLPPALKGDDVTPDEDDDEHHSSDE